MSTLKIAAIGVPWYARERYAHVLQIMEDAEALPASYDEWLKATSTTVRQYEQQGVAVIHAEIEPRTFLAWCRKVHRQPDAAARREFANAVAMASICRYAGNA